MNLRGWVSIVSRIILTVWEEEEDEKSSTWFWGRGVEGAGDAAEDGVAPGLETEEGIGKLRKQKGAECAEEQKRQSGQAREGDVAR